MKTVLIISLLILQSSASFLDVFAPVESSFGKLVTDVVTDIRETIDCTILAVEHVFSLGGLFGDNSDYDEKCKGQKRTTVSGNSPVMAPYSYKTEESPHTESHKHTIQEELSKQVHESVSEANEKIKTILDQSHAQEKMENVKASLKSESDRLVQISALLSQKLEKLPEEVRRKIHLEENRPCIDNILDEIKLLYQVEQKEKTSAEANEVRHAFDQVLNVLQVNDTGGPLSDEGEVKEIIKSLGKVTNDSLVDVENQVSQWTEEQNKDLRDIKDVVLTTNNEELTAASGINNVESKNTAETYIGKDVISEKLDEIEKEQEKIVDFSHNLKEIAKSILDKVSESSTPLSAINEINVPSMISNMKEDIIPSKGSLLNEETASIINEKLDQIEKEQNEVLEVSDTLKNFSKTIILDTVSVSNSSNIDLKNNITTTSTNIKFLQFNTKSNDSLTPEKVQTSNSSVSLTSSSTDIPELVNSELDKIKEEQQEMIDVSQNLQIFANDILNNVNQNKTSVTDIKSSVTDSIVLENNKENKSSASEEAARVTNDKLNKMEKDVEEMDDVSHNLKDLSKGLLDKISETPTSAETLKSKEKDDVYSPHANGPFSFLEENSTPEITVTHDNINYINIQEMTRSTTSTTTSTEINEVNVLVPTTAPEITTQANSTSKIDGHTNIVTTQSPQIDTVVAAQTTQAPPATKPNVSDQEILLSVTTETIQISPLQQTVSPVVPVSQQSQQIESGPMSTETNSAISTSTPQPQVTSPVPVKTTSITTESSPKISKAPKPPITTLPPHVTSLPQLEEKEAHITTITLDITTTTSPPITQATELIPSVLPVSTEPPQTITFPPTTSTVTPVVVEIQLASPAITELPHLTTVPVTEPITQAAVVTSAFPVSTEPTQATTLPPTTSIVPPVVVSSAITELSHLTTDPVSEPQKVPTVPPSTTQPPHIVLPVTTLAPKITVPSTTQPQHILPPAPVIYPPVETLAIVSTSTPPTPTTLPTSVSSLISPSPQTLPPQPMHPPLSVLPLPPISLTPPSAVTHPPTLPPTTQPSPQTTYPTTFKEVARQIMEQTKPVTTTEEVVNDYVETQKEYDEESLFSAFGNAGIDIGNVDSSVFNELFGYQNVAEQRAAVQDAKKLVQQSQRTRNVMNLFKNGDEINAANIFDNPDLLNFGANFAQNQR